MHDVARRPRNTPARLVTGGTFFEELGFHYLGPFDGHDLDTLTPILNNAKEITDEPVLIHVVTKKGKGYEPAENARRQISRRRQVQRRHRRAEQSRGQRAELHRRLRPSA